MACMPPKQLNSLIVGPSQNAVFAITQNRERQKYQKVYIIVLQQGELLYPKAA